MRDTTLCVEFFLLRESDEGLEGMEHVVMAADEKLQPFG